MIPRVGERVFNLIPIHLKHLQMNKKQILKAIKNLAKSQGFYDRLYSKLTDGSEESETYLEELVEQKFKNVVDLITFIEC